MANDYGGLLPTIIIKRNAKFEEWGSKNQDDVIPPQIHKFRESHPQTPWGSVDPIYLS